MSGLSARFAAGGLLVGSRRLGILDSRRLGRSESVLEIANEPFEREEPGLEFGDAKISLTASGAIRRLHAVTLDENALSSCARFP